MKITQAQLAKELGVSQMTVSLALKGDAKRVSDEMRERVMKKARELGYQPHSAARAMKRGSFDCVAYVSSAEGNSFGGQGPIQGAMRVLLPQGMNLMLTELSEAKLQSEGYVPRILQELSVDGLLINYIAKVSKKMQALIAGNRIPAIWLNTKLDENCVYADWEGGAEYIVRHLAANGHRRIAFGTMMENPTFSVGERFAGYMKAMTELGLEPLHAPSNDCFHEWRRELIRSDNPPTAVLAFAVETRWAFAEAREAGLRVPDDISIISFDTLAVETDDRCRVSAMHVSMTELGEVATEMLQERIKNPSISLPARVMPMKFVPGDTFAAR